MHDLDRAMFETEEAGGEQEEAQDFRERDVALASNCSTLRTEAELDQFLGGLLRGVGGATRTFARSGTGRTARRNPPAGSETGPPADPGTANPHSVSSSKGCPPEDREFEMAKAFVRFADAAARAAARSAIDVTPTDTAAAAAMRLPRSPGLLAPPGPLNQAPTERSNDDERLPDPGVGLPRDGGGRAGERGVGAQE